VAGVQWSLVAVPVAYLGDRLTLRLWITFHALTLRSLMAAADERREYTRSVKVHTDAVGAAT
jgi:hypothetical protein